MKHHKLSCLAIWFTGLLLLDQQSALAGMPTVSLSDVGRLRLSTISFFLLLVVLSMSRLLVREF